MRVFFWSMGITAAAFAAHLALWRIHRPRRQGRAIVLLFLAALVIALALVPGMDVPGRLLTALCVVSLLCAYVITYSAFEAQSPTLVMVEKILSAGPEGLDKNVFEGFLTDEVLILPRVQDLLRDNMARMEAGRLVLTAKGRLMARAFTAFRRVLNLGMGG